MQLAIEHVGQYTRPETFVQETPLCHLGLDLSGLDYMKLFVPGRETPLELAGSDLPCVTLLPPGVRVDFRFGRRRENWVIQFRLPELELEPGELRGRLRRDDTRLSVPLFHPGGGELRERFRRIRELWMSGTPADRLAAEWMTSGILGEIIAEKPAPDDRPATPAARFRALIDADAGFRKTLAELSRDAGGDPGYLRKCFEETYRIAPAEYRARRRLGRILELIGQNSLGFKEIAEEVGMRNVTHLHSFVRERCNTTPGLLRKTRRSV